jgi:hypothetical protein
MDIHISSLSVTKCCNVSKSQSPYSKPRYSSLFMRNRNANKQMTSVRSDWYHSIGLLRDDPFDGLDYREGDDNFERRIIVGLCRMQFGFA